MESGPVTLADFQIDAAVRSVAIKLVGPVEAVRVLRGWFRPGVGGAVRRPGRGKRPYPGSTMVTPFSVGMDVHDLHVDGGFLIR